MFTLPHNVTHPSFRIPHDMNWQDWTRIYPSRPKIHLWGCGCGEILDLYVPRHFWTSTMPDEMLRFLFETCMSMLLGAIFLVLILGNWRGSWCKIIVFVVLPCLVRSSRYSMVLVYKEIHQPCGSKTSVYSHIVWTSPRSPATCLMQNFCRRSSCLLYARFAAIRQLLARYDET